jgi:hypothetical protein
MVATFKEPFWLLPVVPHGSELLDEPADLMGQITRFPCLCKADYEWLQRALKIAQQAVSPNQQC